ncbi:MAG TPA: glycosyltransferase 87 family protein, partial [Xanthobacteraceae bacterium]|nr:glycosyltransferase 87 family protein [Xanthobacteraceae bacterium]
MWFGVGLAAAAYYPRFVKLPAGMETYPQAAACLWHGQVLQVCDPGFTYPPFFALVMLPFVPMPLWLRDLVWYGVTLAAAFGAFKLSETIAGKSLAAPLVRAGGPGYFSTWLGEVAGPSLGINPVGAPFAFWDGANILNHS